MPKLRSDQYERKKSQRVPTNKKFRNDFTVKKLIPRHPVVGMRQPTINKSNSEIALKQRHALVGAELDARNKRNVVSDMRFSRNASMNEDDRAFQSFIKERQDKVKKLFSLDDDELDSHDIQVGGLLGAKTLEDDDFFDRVERDERGDSGQLWQQEYSEAHFGGGGHDRPVQEIYSEIIAKDKAWKAEKRRERDEGERKREEIDAEFSEIRDLIMSNVRNKWKTKDSADAPPKTVAEDDFDRRVRELSFSTKGTAGERVKTEEEIAREERKRIEDLEAERLKRMRRMDLSEEEMSSQSDTDEGEEEEEEEGSTEDSSEFGGDLSDEEEPITKQKRTHSTIDEAESDEESDSDASSDDSDSAASEGKESVSFKTLAPHISKPAKPKPTKQERKAKKITTEVKTSTILPISVPYLITTVPSTLPDLFALFATHSLTRPDQQAELLRRIVLSSSVKLNRENMSAVQSLMRVVLDWISWLSGDASVTPPSETPSETSFGVGVAPSQPSQFPSFPSAPQAQSVRSTFPPPPSSPQLDTIALIVPHFATLAHSLPSFTLKLCADEAEHSIRLLSQSPAEVLLFPQATPLSKPQPSHPFYLLPFSSLSRLSVFLSLAPLTDSAHPITLSVFSAIAYALTVNEKRVHKLNSSDSLMKQLIREEQKGQGKTLPSSSLKSLVYDTIQAFVCFVYLLCLMQQAMSVGRLSGEQWMMLQRLFEFIAHNLADFEVGSQSAARSQTYKSTDPDDTTSDSMQKDVESELSSLYPSLISIKTVSLISLIHPPVVTTQPLSIVFLEFLHSLYRSSVLLLFAATRSLSRSLSLLETLSPFTRISASLSPITSKLDQSLTSQSTNLLFEPLTDILSSFLSSLSKSLSSSRTPLLLRAARSSTASNSIASLTPLFSENYLTKGTKERYQQDLKRLKKNLKRNEKGAAREIRKEMIALNEQREKENKRREEKAKAKIKSFMSLLEGQQAEGKMIDRLKTRQKKHKKRDAAKK
ncbi:putative nucleolar protein 14 like protein [Blattamonas nauphoetae]|uniref:Nucleolar protein 14 like protein n=1 Tax=Blattamonas nauphoetae TaxID=2049346 RepID=A0ABQ9Y1B4_9EUKA|nr:putative nucleolar protein 14 like protein [Blattamonas nauphoetae]